MTYSALKTSIFSWGMLTSTLNTCPSFREITPLVAVLLCMVLRMRRPALVTKASTVISLLISIAPLVKYDNEVWINNGRYILHRRQVIYAEDENMVSTKASKRIIYEIYKYLGSIRPEISVADGLLNSWRMSILPDTFMLMVAVPSTLRRRGIPVPVGIVMVVSRNIKLKQNHFVLFVAGIISESHN